MISFEINGKWMMQMTKKTIFEKVIEVLENQSKTIFSTAEIKELCIDKFNLNKTSIIPSDYCYNRTNHGIGEDKNILIFLGFGEYRYVGQDYLYSGWVYHKEKGFNQEQVVGEWRNRQFTKFDSPLENVETLDSRFGVSGLSRERIEDLYSEYVSLLELEISILGCKPTEVRHLIGRIGEFKCAIETEGALSSVPNQHGFDVVTADGKRVSVKTTAQKSGFVSINANTLHIVDELMVIQYTRSKFTIVYYGDIDRAIEVSRIFKNKYELDISKARRLQKQLLS
jgi:hypothetical protein